MKTFRDIKIKKEYLIYTLLCMCLCGVFLTGCTQQLLPSPIAPVVTNPDDVVFSAPKNVVASHGLKKKIVLSWDEVPLATYYYVWMAKSPEDEFEQVFDTKSTSANLEVLEGDINYYKVIAKNSLEEKKESLIVCGSSLAVPEITSITEAVGKTTVRWYMSNLNADTYANDVEFQVHCVSSDKTEEYVHNIRNSTDTSCVFDELTPEKQYIYYIDAIVGDAKETSSKKDSVTLANSQTPSGPVMKKLINPSSFRIADLTTADNETPIETIQWTINDEATEINDEAVDYYKVQIKNLNCSNKYYTIAKINADGSKAVLSDEAPSWADVKVWGSKSDCKAFVKPLNSGNKADFNDITTFHDGILKVMRDYKHYYRFVPVCKNGTELAAIENESKYVSYRKISNKEFAMCVALNIADSMHQTKGKEGTLNGSEGTLVTDWTFSKDHWTYIYNGFVNNFQSLPGKSGTLKSFIKLQCSKSQNGKAVSDKVFGLGEATVYVTDIENNLPSYSGRLKMSAGNTASSKSVIWSVEMVAKNNAIVIEPNPYLASSNEAACKAIFPFQFGTVLSKSGIDYPTKNGVWWEARN